MNSMSAEHHSSNSPNKGASAWCKLCRRRGKRYTACGVWLCMIPCFNEYHSIKHVWFISLSCVIPQLVDGFGISHFIVLFGILQFIVLFARTPNQQSDNLWSLFQKFVVKNCCIKNGTLFSTNSFGNDLAKCSSSTMYELGIYSFCAVIRHSDVAKVWKGHQFKRYKLTFL